MGKAIRLRQSYVLKFRVNIANSEQNALMGTRKPWNVSWICNMYSLRLSLARLGSHSALKSLERQDGLWPQTNGPPAYPLHV